MMTGKILVVAAFAFLAVGCAKREPGIGFVKVEKINGRWMFISPDGKPFRSRGMDWANYDGFRDAKTGRSLYREANDAKYKGDKARWSADAAAQMKSWGFNSLGGGHTEDLRTQGLYFASGVPINTFARSGTNVAERSIGPKFPNVFHPEWEAFCDEQARKWCPPMAENRMLIGWFISNELHWWGSGKGEWKFGLFGDAARLPDSHSAKRALLDFCGGTTNVGAEVKTAFVRHCAERYFSVACAAVRRYDPNHLIMGCRFMGWEGGAIPEVWEVAAKYCDVISFNQYPRFTNGVIRVRKEPFTDAIARLDGWTGGKPLFISEWSFLAKDSGLPCEKGAGHVFQTQDERAEAVSAFLAAIDPHPSVVGHNFFMWVDMPAGGLKSGATGENGNYGLVNSAGQPYRQVVDAFRRWYLGRDDFSGQRR